VTLFLIELISCRNAGDSLNKDIVFHINIDNCKTSIDLKLSDLIDSCRLVPLGTINESVLGRFFKVLIITDDLILIADENGVYKFSSDGKFIKKLIKKDRGPQGISGSCIYYYYEERNLLFIADDLVE